MPGKKGGKAIERLIYIQGSPERVWRALTRGAELGRWYTTPHKLVLRKDGRWDFLEGKMTGKVLGVARPRKLVTSLRFLKEESSTRVTFLLEPVKLGRRTATELKVVHDRFAGAKETCRCWSSPGAWTWILCNLKTFVETGKPLTERSFY